MRARLQTTPRADAEAWAAEAWWRANRPAAPNRFRSELAGAFALLGQAPEAGRRYRVRGLRGVRRLLLAVSAHHVYYVYDAPSATVTILAVWGAVRGRGPGLAAARRP